mgnify:CR=1 FL=1
MPGIDGVQEVELRIGIPVAQRFAGLPADQVFPERLRRLARSQAEDPEHGVDLAICVVRQINPPQMMRAKQQPPFTDFLADIQHPGAENDEIEVDLAGALQKPRARIVKRRAKALFGIFQPAPHVAPAVEVRIGGPH